MIGKAQPATRMLQEGVSPFFQTLAPLGHPVVPDVLGLEVLVDGEEDGVVGGGHPCDNTSGWDGLLGLPCFVGKQHLDRRFRGESPKRVFYRVGQQSRSGQGGVGLLLIGYLVSFRKFSSSLSSLVSHCLSFKDHFRPVPW